MTKKLTLLEWLDAVEYALNVIPNTRLSAAPNGTKNTYELAGQAKAMLEKVRTAQLLLVDNLSAWEDEEDSVQREHRLLIKRTKEWVDND